MNSPLRCPRCGTAYEGTPEICSNCQLPIDVSGVDLGFRPDQFGSFTFVLHAGTAPGPVWDELRSFWKQAEHPWLPSQFERFETTSDSVTVLGPERLSEHSGKLMKGRGTVEFKAIPDEEVPWLPTPEPREHPDWYKERIRLRKLKKKGQGGA